RRCVRKNPNARSRRHGDDEADDGRDRRGDLEHIAELRIWNLELLTPLNDAHCHFFSTPFFASLGGNAALTTLGWEPPGDAASLADRWVSELDRHQVGRAALIASVPGDAAS